MTAPLIFPMGHYLGAAHPAADGRAEVHLVRIGWDLHELDGPAQLAVWALAHGLPEGHEMQPWTAAAAVGAARATGIADADSALTGLIAKELVVEVSPGTPQARDFAAASRIRTLLTGLGNTPTDPLFYGIGQSGQLPALRVPAFAYELWKWGHACDNLWHACQIFAHAGRAVGPLDPQRVEPERILDRCLAAAQVLIAHGAAYLDQARQLDPEPDHPHEADPAGAAPVDVDPAGGGSPGVDPAGSPPLPR